MLPIAQPPPPERVERPRPSPIISLPVIISEEEAPLFFTVAKEDQYLHQIIHEWKIAYSSGRLFEAFTSNFMAPALDPDEVERIKHALAKPITIKNSRPTAPEFLLTVDLNTIFQDAKCKNPSEKVIKYLGSDLIKKLKESYAGKIFSVFLLHCHKNPESFFLTPSFLRVCSQTSLDADFQIQPFPGHFESLISIFEKRMDSSQLTPVKVFFHLKKIKQMNEKWGSEYLQKVFKEEKLDINSPTLLRLFLKVEAFVKARDITHGKNHYEIRSIGARNIKTHDIIYPLAMARHSLFPTHSLCLYLDDLFEHPEDPKLVPFTSCGTVMQYFSDQNGGIVTTDEKSNRDEEYNPIKFAILLSFFLEGKVTLEPDLLENEIQAFEIFCKKSDKPLDKVLVEIIKKRAAHYNFNPERTLALTIMACGIFLCSGRDCSEAINSVWKEMQVFVKRSFFEKKEPRESLWKWLEYSSYNESLEFESFYAQLQLSLFITVNFQNEDLKCYPRMIGQTPILLLRNGDELGSFFIYVPIDPVSAFQHLSKQEFSILLSLGKLHDTLVKKEDLKVTGKSILEPYASHSKLGLKKLELFLTEFATTESSLHSNKMAIELLLTLAQLRKNILPALLRQCLRHFKNSDSYYLESFLNLFATNPLSNEIATAFRELTTGQEFEKGIKYRNCLYILLKKGCESLLPVLVDEYLNVSLDSSSAALLQQGDFIRALNRLYPCEGGKFLLELSRRGLTDKTEILKYILETFCQFQNKEDSQKSIIYSHLVEALRCLLEDQRAFQLPEDDIPLISTYILELLQLVDTEKEKTIKFIFLAIKHHLLSIQNPILTKLWEETASHFIKEKKDLVKAVFVWKKGEEIGVWPYCRDIFVKHFQQYLQSELFDSTKLKKSLTEIFQEYLHGFIYSSFSTIKTTEDVEIYIESMMWFDDFSKAYYLSRGLLETLTFKMVGIHPLSEYRKTLCQNWLNKLSLLVDRKNSYIYTFLYINALRILNSKPLGYPKEFARLLFRMAYLHAITHNKKTIRFDWGIFGQLFIDQAKTFLPCLTINELNEFISQLHQSMKDKDFLIFLCKLIDVEEFSITKIYSLKNLILPAILGMPANDNSLNVQAINLLAETAFKRNFEDQNSAFFFKLAEMNAFKKFYGHAEKWFLLSLKQKKCWEKSDAYFLVNLLRDFKRFDQISLFFSSQWQKNAFIDVWDDILALLLQDSIPKTIKLMLTNPQYPIKNELLKTKIIQKTINNVHEVDVEMNVIQRLLPLTATVWLHILSMNHVSAFLLELFAEAPPIDNIKALRSCWHFFVEICSKRKPELLQRFVQTPHQFIEMFQDGPKIMKLALLIRISGTGSYESMVNFWDQVNLLDQLTEEHLSNSLVSQAAAHLINARIQAKEPPHQPFIDFIARCLTLPISEINYQDLLIYLAQFDGQYKEMKKRVLLLLISHKPNEQNVAEKILEELSQDKCALQ